MLDAVSESRFRAGPPHEDGLPVPRRYWSMLTIWMAMSMTVLDGSIANVALPSIARELNANAAASIWIVNAYQLAITISLLPLAALGDRLGHRRIYMAGLGAFTVGSLLCALSRTLPELAAARVFQGLGAAGIMSINAALVRFTYPRHLLGRAIGMNAVVISISAAIGPTAASAILGVASWQWLFAVNVPIGIIAIGVAVWALPRTRGSGRGFDVVSAVLNAVAFGMLILGAESVAREGLVVGAGKLALGAAAAGVLVLRELRRPEPLVPFDLLRIPIFGLSIATSIVSFSAQMLAYVALPFYLQVHMGRSVVETGLLLTPWPLAVAVSAPTAGRLADRYPAGGLGGVGLALFACGLLALALLGPHASNLDIAWRTALCGFGFGFFQSPNNRAMVSSAPVKRSGAAGGMLATARLLGQTAGAVATAIFFRIGGTEATVAALGSAAAVAAVAAGVSLLRLKLARRPRPIIADPAEEIPAGP
jgi:DHA2 family multidrug resistance protein-like MFS transporter